MSQNKKKKPVLKKRSISLFNLAMLLMTAAMLYLMLEARENSPEAKIAAGSSSSQSASH